MVIQQAGLRSDIAGNVSADLTNCRQHTVRTGAPFIAWNVITYDFLARDIR
jgi:hypothetical protein